ncbi:Hypothetical protein CINCED_3A021152 [Cinara cedri]|uniref:Uncharacterized protein n=1 Tax=Cinara cedri TaxID=506608 RepID=A0A5E4N7I2_9HEMI|nr:Hypothetical protein CINCED_3A021152 [Cinara cedri]
MSSKIIRQRQMTKINNENPVKNIKNTLIVNRKQSALKVLTNTVQSTKKKSPNKSLKNLKAFTMDKFEMDVKCKSPSADISYNQNNDEFNHINCSSLLENDSLPSSMTCNIGMLSDFFNFKNGNDNWFLEDYNKIMINKIQNTFENFGEPDMEPYSLPPMPKMDFSEIPSF